MTDLCQGAVRFLEAAYDDERSLFSYSTSLRNGAYIQDFEHPRAVRYTINSLLGLQEAARHDQVGDPFLAEAGPLVDRFHASRHATIENFADLGLLAVLLCERGNTDAALDSVARIRRAVSSRAIRRLALQDVTWMLWGLVSAARLGLPEGEAGAGELFKVVHARFLNRDSLLARHDLNPVRRNFVSFGATAYFLRALHEYADAFQDEYVDTLFRFAVQRVMETQGPYGEWPWMLNVDSAMPIDFYPVFSVHQDSMAMLFLLPALDRGVPGVRDAIARSLAWVEGNNELETAMVVDDPFFIFRSVERTGGLQVARRYIRALWRSALERPDSIARGDSVRINRECRSYHLGWILYAWSGRPDRPSLKAPVPA